MFVILRSWDGTGREGTAVARYFLLNKFMPLPSLQAMIVANQSISPTILSLLSTFNIWYLLLQFNPGLPAAGFFINHNDHHLYLVGMDDQ